MTTIREQIPTWSTSPGDVTEDDDIDLDAVIAEHLHNYVPDGMAGTVAQSSSFSESDPITLSMASKMPDLFRGNGGLLEAAKSWAKANPKGLNLSEDQGAA